MSPRARRRRVVVVTGGGGGIGAAVAEELGRRGCFVVTVDPLVTLDGAEALPAPRETTADRIVAAGGAALASSASVTDGPAVRALFDELAAEHGGVDGVVNVAGITRPTSFATGTEADWAGVLDVHLGGWLHVLGAALPLMAAAGHGRIVGVTSGSGWRAADAGAYSSAKRSVASLTWQLGRVAPEGVAVNALSPIANTRMVAGALERARKAAEAKGTAASGGLSLTAMPEPADLAPLGAHLVDDGFGWCRGRVLFTGGSEMALVDEPRLLEVVPTAGVASVASLLDAVVPSAFAAAEAAQASGGGSNPRFAALLDGGGRGGAERRPAAVRACVVASDRPALAAAVTAALEARGVACHPAEAATDFAGAARSLGTAVEQAGAPVDAVVVALAGGAASPSATAWERVLAEHAGLVGQLHADAAWARAAADVAAAADRPLRLVTLTDATTAGGRSRAQSAAQLARSARGDDRQPVTAFAVAVEAATGEGQRAAAELAAHLLAHPDAAALAGAELAAGDGWVGLRSHPRPGGSIAYGGPALPAWFDATLRDLVRA